MQPEDLTTHFTLYHATYSIRAIMVRATHGMAGKPRDARPHMIMKLEQMDLMPEKPDQLTEFFLCHVNPDGRVPVLTNEKLLPQPIHETLDITWYLCDWYPSLVPTEHETIIKSLIRDLHQINFAVLTFGPHDKHVMATIEWTQKTLGRQDISDEYRRGLEHKLCGLQSLQDSMSAPGLAEHESRIRELFTKTVALLESNGTITSLVALNGIGFIFGTQPTALDAHILPLVRRMHDANREDLVPEVLIKWGDKFSQEDLWDDITINRSTNPPGT